jgi:hypothetical protein
LLRTEPVRKEIIEFISKKKLFLIERIENFINVKFRELEVNRYVKTKSKTLEQYKDFTIKAISDVMLMAIRKKYIKDPPKVVKKKKQQLIQLLTNRTKTETCGSPPMTLRTINTHNSEYSVNSIFTEASRIRGYKSLIKPHCKRRYDCGLMTIERVEEYDNSRLNTNNYNSISTVNRNNSQRTLTNSTIFN